MDELNASLGQAAVTAAELEPREPKLGELRATLRRLQHELFNLGSLLATRGEDVGPKQPRITAEDVRRLESEIDRVNEELPELDSFVLPGRQPAERGVAPGADGVPAGGTAGGCLGKRRGGAGGKRSGT